MGGALALRLAQEHGAAGRGLVLVNPANKFEDPRLVALPVIQHLVPARSRGSPATSRSRASPSWATTRTPLKAGHSQIVAWRIDHPRPAAR